MNIQRRELLPGVTLTAVQTEKFKTGYHSLNLLLPLEQETASLNALLPMVLRRGTRRLPDLEALSAALDDLYGGVIEPAIRKRGETQCVGFSASFLDDAFVPEGGQLAGATGLLGELLLQPAGEDGFVPGYVAGERDNLMDELRSQINDKRQYAQNRLMELMYQDEPFGVDRLGSLKRAEAITPEKLYAHYQKVLAQGEIALYYCGSAGAEQVSQAWKAALAGLPREGARPRSAGPRENGEREETAPREHEEAMDVTQGKLALGFRTNCDVYDERYPGLVLFNAIYGGSTTSRLFLHVREKLSLCYYASSGLEKLKGLLLVSSGVEFDHREEAQTEILKQFSLCRAGKFEDGELEAARRYLVSALRSTSDSQGQLEDFWLGQAVAGLDYGPEELAKRIEEATREDVTAAAQDIRLDTVYFLKGKEEA